MAHRYHGHRRRRRASPARVVLVIALVLFALGALFLYVLPTYFVPHYLVAEEDGVHLQFWFVDVVVSTATARPDVLSSPETIATREPIDYDGVFPVLSLFE